MAAAARALELNAALVGRQIQWLEDGLGVRLFERKGRWQRLTPAGQQYHQQCRAILEMVRGAEAGLRESAAAVSGRLRVHAPVTFGLRRLAPALAGFLAEYPQIQVALVLDDRSVDPVDDGFDAVFHLGPVLEDDLEFWPLGEQPLLMVAAPAYLERQGRPERAEALLGHRCLGFIVPEPPVLGACGFQTEAAESDPDAPDAPDAQAEAEELEDAADAESAGLAPALVLQSNHAQALHLLALQGAGITVLPRCLVEADVEAGRLVSLLSECLPAAEPLSLVIDADRTPSEALQVFVDWALDQFRPLEASEAASALPAATDADAQGL